MVGLRSDSAWSQPCRTAIGRQQPSSARCARPGSRRPLSSTEPSTGRASSLTSNRSSSQPCGPVISSFSTTCRAIRSKVSARPSRPQAPSCATRRPIRLTSIQSSSYLPNSNRSCARRLLEQLTFFGTPSDASSRASTQTSAQTTSATQVMYGRTESALAILVAMRIALDAWWLWEFRDGYPLNTDEVGYLTFALDDTQGLKSGGLA